MEKFFNTAGPQILEDHYTIKPLTRVHWQDIKTLIQQKRYFLLHAPRQTGKTTALLAMIEVLNREGRYTALYADIEGAQTARNDVTAGIDTICSVLAGSLSYQADDDRLLEWHRNERAQHDPNDRFRSMLQHWSRISEKPIVLFLDEVDALVGDTLISLLRQLRAGYNQRPAAFPHSVVLCGVRDIRDYRIHQGNGEIITGGSAFNIKAESLTLGNFTKQEVYQLYQQHTDATGQTFDESIYPELWLDTAGQPWLVNALGHEMIWKDRTLRDRTQPITLQHYLAARERLIQSRATHLDQLADKLRESRVHHVIAPILAGESRELHDHDLQYCQDLGLIRTRPELAISNRIYREILPRELTYGLQASITNQNQLWYLQPDRRLNMVKLLQAFQQFFREHSESWLERFDYKEAGPQLLMQAFLQRILNGGGRIMREYALGRRRTDLTLEWPLDEEQGFFGPIQRIVIELKIQRGDLQKLIEEGKQQTRDYADGCGAEESHLVIFNRNSEVSWEDRLWYRPSESKGEPHLWGC